MSLDFWGKEQPVNGAELLGDVEEFLARFIAYPSEIERIAHTLWIAHTWYMDCWESTPRIAFLSPEPGSGKSRCLEVTEPLVPRPVHAVNTTPAYLFRKVSDPDGPPTILYDEIDTVFGPRAKDNEDVRGMLNAGHRRGATAGRCVMRGKNVETEELPAYCAVALAGLNDLPDTIMTRSVVVRMRRRATSERIEPWRLRVNGPEAEELAERLARWADETSHQLGDTWPEMPDGIEDRNADVWEALLIVADHAGGRWPNRARVAAVAAVAEASTHTPSLGVMLLADLRVVFSETTTSRLPTETILDRLHEMDESPWADLHHGKALDARGLANRLRRYDVRSKSIRLPDDRVVRGYDVADLADPWSRYLDDDAPPASRQESATSATGATETAEPVAGVADVADVADSPEGAPAQYELDAALDQTEKTCDCGRPVPAGYRMCRECIRRMQEEAKRTA